LHRGRRLIKIKVVCPYFLSWDQPNFREIHCMIIVWGSIEARAESFAEARRLSLEHVHRSRGEPGCISHSVQIDVENPNRLVFFEEWEDESALQAHFVLVESRDFVSKVSRLAVTPPEIRIYESNLVR
jgi:quinol monooxygenase YgiN